MRYICIPKSEPTKSDSDGDTYTDDIDLDPKTPAIYGGQFVFSETEWTSEYIPCFNDIYTTHATDMATWGQHPELADDPKVYATYFEADTLSYACNGIKDGNAAYMLHHYLGATGTDCYISVENLTTDSQCGKRLYEENLAMLEDHVKSVLACADGFCPTIADT